MSIPIFPRNTHTTSLDLFNSNNCKRPIDSIPVLLGLPIVIGWRFYLLIEESLMFAMIYLY